MLLEVKSNKFKTVSMGKIPTDKSPDHLTCSCHSVSQNMRVLTQTNFLKRQQHMNLYMNKR